MAWPDGRVYVLHTHQHGLDVVVGAQTAPDGFYIRRIFRIYPAAIVIVLITVLFKLPAMHTGFATGFVYPRPSLYDVVCNLLLLQNLHGIQIVGVMWSLPLEMQMYIVLPVLFFFVIRYRALWTLLLLWLLTVVTLQSIFRTYASPPMNLVTCGPYFLPGVMAYIGFGSRKPILPAWSFPLFLLGLTAVFLYTSPSLTHAWWFCLILGVSVPFFKQVRMEAVRKIVQKIAQYSYGIYSRTRLPTTSVLRSCMSTAFFFVWASSQEASQLLVCDVPPDRKAIHRPRGACSPQGRAFLRDCNPSTAIKRDAFQLNEAALRFVFVRI